MFELNRFEYAAEVYGAGGVALVLDLVEVVGKGLAYLGLRQLLAHEYLVIKLHKVDEVLTKSLVGHVLGEKIYEGRLE
jgi:hypothetical protein